MTIDATAHEAVSTLDAGSIEYGAIPQPGTAALQVAWRYRVSRPGNWFSCGELIPHGSTYAVRGWDGQPITRVRNVRDGLDAVRAFYATAAIGSATPGPTLRF